MINTMRITSGRKIYDTKLYSSLDICFSSSSKLLLTYNMKCIFSYNHLKLVHCDRMPVMHFWGKLSKTKILILIDLIVSEI